jgi:hypothetical protein
VARSSSVIHLQLERQPAGLQQRLHVRVTVDQVPHLGVGVLCALLDGHAAVPVRHMLQVCADPPEQGPFGAQLQLATGGRPRRRAALRHPAVSVDRHDVLADHHRDPEPAGLAAGGHPQLDAGRLGGAERRQVQRHCGLEPAHPGVEHHVAVARLPRQLDQLLEPAGHEHRRHQPVPVERVLRVRGIGAIALQIGSGTVQGAPVLGAVGERGGRTQPRAHPHLRLREPGGS